jgi:hypothetical protein
MLCVLGVLSLAAAAWAQPEGPVLLRFKFMPGHVDALNLNVTGHGEMAMTGVPGVGRVSFPLVLELNVPLDLIVRSVDAAGNGTFAMRLGEMGLELHLMGQTLHLSMGAGPTAATVGTEHVALPGMDMSGAIKLVSWVMSPQGKVLSVRGLDKFAQALQIPMAAMLAGMSQDQMLQMVQSRAVQLPDQPVNGGDSWTQNVVLPLPGGQTLQAPFTYTLEALGAEQGHPLARLDLSGNLELHDVTLPAQSGATSWFAMPAPPPGVKTTLDLLLANLTGQIYLPLDGGYVHSARMAMDLNLQSSAQLPERASGATMRMSLTNMKFFYDLTPRK